MAIHWNIPHQARFFTTSNRITADFNTVDGVATGSGQYDFNQAVNQQLKICDLFRNSVYLIERLNVGGTISEEIFLNSIATRPEIILRKKLGNQAVYKQPIPIVNYIDGMEITNFIKSDIAGDELQLNCTGLLNQIAETVGVSEISLELSFNIYAIESSYWNTNFRNNLLKSAGEQLRV